MLKRDLLESLTQEEFDAYEGPTVEEMRAALDRGRVKRDAAVAANRASARRAIERALKRVDPRRRGPRKS